MERCCEVGAGGTYLALRVGFLRPGWLLLAARVGADCDWFRACTTALATSEASCGCVSSMGGTSTKPSYALSMYQAFFHRVLSWALWTIWLNARWGGTSIKMLPGDCIWNCTLTATLSSRSPFILRICPSHLYRRLRISRTRSYVLVFALASTCLLRPVILLRHLELAPLIAAIVASSKFQASDPYVNNEQIAHL